jgi:hypothetical protein
MYILQRKCRKIIRTIFLFFIHPIIISPLLGAAKPVYVLEEDYIAYPYTVELAYNFGFTNSIFQILRPNIKEGGAFSCDTRTKNLIVHTVVLDIGWTQISKAWYNFISCYPKLGFDIKYSRFENKGNIVSALLYMAPQSDYLSVFEFLPQIGLGVAYLNIPVVYPTQIEKLNADGEIEYEEEPQNIMHEVPFRKGIGLELDLGFNFEIRPHPNWIVKPAFGFVYLPDFNRIVKQELDNQTNSESKADQDEVYIYRKRLLLNKDTDILLYTFGIGVSYIPNPNTTTYYTDEELANNNSSVKITFSYSKKKYDKITEYEWRKLLTDLSKQYEDEMNSDKVPTYSNNSNQDLLEVRDEMYDVFGINLQWAIKCTDNHAFVFSSEMIFDQANKALMDALDLVRNSSMKFAFAMGHDFLYGNLSFGQQLGFYIRNSVYSVKLSSWLREIAYLRLNIDYKIKGHWVIGMSIRNRLEILYDDRDKQVNSAISFESERIYEYGIKMDYPEVYIGYAF